MVVDGAGATRVMEGVASRRRRARGGATWSLRGEAARFRALAAEAEGSGLLDVAALDAFEARVTDLLDDAVARHVDGLAHGEAVAVGQAVFGSTSYRNRLDRQLAVGAAAAAMTLAEESALAAVSDVLRRLCLPAGEDLAPAWPARSLVADDGRAAGGAGGEAA